jgi:hypothetical protein
MLHRWFLWILFLLIFGCWYAVAQTAAADSNQPTAKPDVTTTGVAPNDVVETIHGFCDNALLIDREKSASAATSPEAAKPGSTVPGGSGESTASGSNGTNSPECKTVITRAEFEKLAALLDLGSGAANRSGRLKFGVRYPEMLLFASKALQAGIDKEPGFQTRARYTYLMLLSQAFTRRIQEEKTTISDEEFASEYKDHPELFEKLELLRIFIPKQKHHTSGVEMLRDAAADEAAMKAEAQLIRKKALAGGNFAKLEKEVYAFAGEDPEEAPEVELGFVTRSSAERQYQDVVFHLKPGQISDLVPAPLGWHIFKLVSKSEVPMSDAKNILLSLRAREAIDAAKAELKTDFNDAYFNVPGGMDPAKPAGAAANPSANQSK